MNNEAGRYNIVRVAKPANHRGPFDDANGRYDVVWQEPTRSDHVIAYGVYYQDAVAVVDALTMAQHAKQSTATNLSLDLP